MNRPDKTKCNQIELAWLVFMKEQDAAGLVVVERATVRDFYIAVAIILWDQNSGAIRIVIG